jgi:minor histocompatibility antigen H13
MADSIAEEVLVNETNETLSNMSNTTGRQAASTEGLVTAYLLMFLMALFPIFVGSIRSVTYHYNLKKKGEEAEERIRMRDAAIFPIYASGCLFGLYLVFKYLPKDFVNLLLNILFFSVGVTALTRFGRLLFIFSFHYPLSPPPLSLSLPLSLLPFFHSSLSLQCCS